ncbi:MAG TPA: SGNH/GDSL hydrolase family protein, partial [Actinomycetes bacterium]|nr:SGNH/GDSL hydrolase family protein [Actinomycetes bacterium]
LVLVFLAAGLLVGLLTPVSAAARPALPNSMAALGDSITRAYDVCCSYGDHPGQSWSTGGAWYDGISSHYERIRRRNSAISGHAHNSAVTGAKMSAAPAQARAAAAQHVDYVTVLLGANDLCTSSPSTMTPTDTFKSQFRQAMVILKEQLPQARIFVSSIPDIYQLWKVLHTNRVARTVWATAGICPSMLGPTRTETQRQQVVAREVAFNQILAEGCHQYGDRCRWDGGATYNYKFSTSQVSVLDFFHPDLDGQAALASVTWATSWWPTT